MDPVQQPSPKLQSQEQNDRHLSAWEQWILQKAKEDRDAAEVKLRTQQEMETRAQEDRPELEKKKAEMADKVQAWIDKYDAEMKRKRRLQRKREKAEQELKEEKKLEVLNKANEKFQVCNITLPVDVSIIFTIYYAPAPNRRGHRAMLLSDVCLSDVCLSVAYIGPKSRTETPRKTKIGTGVAHVTDDSDTTFKVKRSRSPGRFTHRSLNASGSCSISC